MRRPCLVALQPKHFSTDPYILDVAKPLKLVIAWECVQHDTQAIWSATTRKARVFKQLP
jgi:hypothetical protein